ncbi:hypothetical protein ASF32_23735 [Methylobacterium sp. Leaf91]|nr:hypothetical protein ASF32_23735 [Methylobacterium sp. Leaf91]
MATPVESDCVTYWADFVRPDGTVSLTLMLFALDDREARRKAKWMVDDHAVDLWDGVRVIGRFPSI